MTDVCLQQGRRIIILGYNCLWGRFGSRLKREPLGTLQNLPGLNIQLHTAGSDGGQQTTFSRKRAGKRFALRVSAGKQTVTVCTQGERYQPAIISRQEFLPSLNTHPLRAPIDLDSLQSPGKNGSSDFVHVTL